MNNRYKLWFHSYMYMYLVHDYRYGLPHRASIPMCCRARLCGQRLWKSKAKQKIRADLKIAFDIDTSVDDVNTHPGRFCLLCKHSMERTICAIMERVHHKCTVSVCQWQKHTDSECKVQCKHVLYLNNSMI